MAFVFNVETPQSANTSDTPTKQIDWAGRTKYLVEKCGTKDKAQTEVFIISGVIDLGLQSQEDGKSEWKGTEEDKVAELAKNPNQYWEVLPNDKNIPTEYKRWPSKPQQAVAIMADNPRYLLDQEQFFNEDGKPGEERPLRMLLNNEWFVKGVGRTVNKNGYSTKENRNDDGSWSLKNNTILYKLGAATETLTTDKKFKPAQLGALIGKPILCQFQVTSNKVGDKEYLNEKISFKGEVPDMMKSLIPELDPKYLFCVNFKGPQDPEVLKTLRQSVILTMQNALNFEGSDIQKALIEIGKIKASDSNQNQSEQAIPRPTAPQEPRKVEPSPTPQDIDFDDPESLPF